ncbi:Plasmodium exported protein, unknown function [Plasmodium gonderi]|uniref:Pv-fam-d protein n=1 Tax=Plasmodium gonderi TaxID=77519 RepID=A0A1Y1JG28_PLAGO|nr:Plasmodium exported protein, unknown function [Plasmodium gonderi]GAW79044.1 Plasmodium exported protein, unknown function [Plasmodium gonderi]
MGKTLNRPIYLFFKLFAFALLIWTLQYSNKSFNSTSFTKKQLQNGNALSCRFNRLLSKEPVITAKEEPKKNRLRERVLKILKEDDSNLGRMLNNLVHDVNFQKQFNALLLDKSFERQFNELVSDSHLEEKSLNSMNSLNSLNSYNSLNSLEVNDESDLKNKNVTANPEQLNSNTNDNNDLDTNINPQNFDENLEKKYHPTIPPENAQKPSGETSPSNIVEQLLDEIKKADNLDRMLDILKFYGSLKEFDNSQLLKQQQQQQQQQQQPIPVQPEIKEQLQSELEAQIKAQLQAQIKEQGSSRKKKSKGKSIILTLCKKIIKLDKKYEDHLINLFTTNYSFLIKHGKITKFRYYLDILIAVSPVIVSGLILLVFINNFNLGYFLTTLALASFSFLYFLFKMWNCKRICKGPGKFKVRQKYKEVVEVLKK